MRGHTLLNGEYDSGKATICAALELVLGVERLNQFPVIEKCDFYNCQYLDSDDKPIDIRVQVVLTNLSKQEKYRFRVHLRLWDDANNTFTDGLDNEKLVNDGDKLHWVLPVIFIGRYDQNDFTFGGDTFFDHPADSGRAHEGDLGAGRTLFDRENKLHCGFLFLGPDRSASHLLALNNGSLLGRLLLIARDPRAEIEVKPDLLNVKQDLSDDVSFGFDSVRNSGFQRRPLLNHELVRQILDQAPSAKISDEIHKVISQLVNAVSHNRTSPISEVRTAITGLILTELLRKLSKLRNEFPISLIIEEPELSLFPHDQRHLIRIISSGFVQAIVVTNTIAIVENFDFESIVTLVRHQDGLINGEPTCLEGFESRLLKSRGHELSQVLFSPSVLVVESGSVAAAFSEALSVLERILGDEKFADLGFAGITIFNAQNVKMIPRYAPFFKSLNKVAFAFYDAPEKEFNDEASLNLNKFVRHWQSPSKGFVNLLVSETAPELHRRFLEAADRLDSYPRQCGTYDALLDDDSTVCEIVTSVLRACYYDAGFFAALFIRQCRSVSDLPQSIRQVMLEIKEEIAKIEIYNNK